MKKALLTICSILACLSMMTACDLSELFEEAPSSTTSESQVTTESPSSEEDTSGEGNSANTPCVEHTGGEATCTEKAVCDICGEAYGAEPAGHQYTELKYDADSHWYECGCGAKDDASDVAHSGGTATCTDKAVCEVCEQAYGAEPAGHQYTELKYDADSHWYECGCGAKDAASDVAHSGGTATCTDKAV